MSQNWLDILGWTKSEVDDLRYVAFYYIKQGIYNVALTLYDAVEVLIEPNAYDLQTIGALHLQLGQGLKALAYLDRALQKEPHHLPTQLNRAKALFMLGHQSEGIEQAEALERCGEPEIASAAGALLMGYR
ncbi:MAG: type III secretion chaperone [Chlamydiia bacterium]|nr:type III secretion chaperone [Chlamydiia bacterium]